jgi:hypothetical protein
VIRRAPRRLRALLGGKAFLLVPVSATRFRPEGLPDGYAVVFEKTDGPAGGSATSAILVQPGQPEIRMARQ